MGIWVDPPPPTSSGEYPDEGTYAAVIAKFWDVGLQDGKYGVKNQVVVAYELDARDSKGRRFVVMDAMTKSIHPKSGLMHLLRSAGVKTRDGEGADISKAEGLPLLLQIEHTPRGRARVRNVMKAMAGSKTLKPERDYGNPWGLAKMLIERALTEDEADIARQAFESRSRAEKAERQAAAAPPPRVQEGADVDDVPDDDIPF